MPVDVNAVYACKPDMDTPTADQGTVLLVDDNPTNLGVLFDSLADSGFKLLAAQDGESAIAQIQYMKPDIILLDVMMPGIDGFETCRRLKAEPTTHDIPVIFMTALTDTVDKIKGFSVGAVDYVTKPIQPEEVLARITAHLAVQKLQHQLQQQNHQLQQEIGERQQVEQSLRVLLHAVSHDLRNPVTGMQMVLKNLLTHADLGDGHAGMIAVPRPILERMIQGSDRQLKLINSLLEAHVSEQQGMTLHPEPVQLYTLAVKVLQDLEPLIIKNQATLDNRLPIELPLIQADPTQLWRVFENLIVNSLKHNPPGVRLVLDAQIEARWLRCWVADNGKGIPTEQKDQLFDLYQRGNATRHTHGLGLGLYLCKQIITAHGGMIDVINNPESGATFWFTLPLDDTVAPNQHSNLATVNS